RRLKHPGEPQVPLFVVVENSTNKVKFVSSDRGQALAYKIALDEGARAIQQATDNRLWQGVSFSSELRRPTHAVTTRTFVRENKTRADIIERTGKDGEKTVTVLLTRETQDPDGRTRTIGRVYDLDELRQLKRLYEENPQMLKPEQERRAPEPAP